MKKNAITNLLTTTGYSNAEHRSIYCEQEIGKYITSKL